MSKSPDFANFYKPEIAKTYLFDEVNFESARKVIMDIDTANSDPKIESILLTICSGGGRLMAGFSLFEHIQNSTKPVNILVNSWCGSAALMILQSGKKRFATKMSRFLAHSSSHSIKKEMPIEELGEYLKMNEVSHQTFIDLTIHKTKMTYADFLQKFTPTTNFDAKEALKLGFLDEII